MPFQRATNFLIAVLLVFAFVQNAQAVIIHDDAQSDPTWQQEYITLGQKYDCVGVLYGKNDTGWHTLGSGVVYGDGTHVIGAAHSAMSNYNATYPQYAFITGNNFINDYWGIYYTSQVSVIPEFHSILTSPDMAVWTFSSAIPNVTPAQLYTGSDSALLGSTLNLVGFGDYGYPSTGNLGTDGYKRGCQDTLYELGDSIYGAASDQLIMSFGLPGAYDYHHLGGCSAPGDSGGGWFTSGGLLAGVNNWNYGGPDYGDSGATSISQHLDYIYSVPESGTIVMLDMAALVFFLFRKMRHA